MQKVNFFFFLRFIFFFLNDLFLEPNHTNIFFSIFFLSSLGLKSFVDMKVKGPNGQLLVALYVAAQEVQKKKKRNEKKKNSE